MRTEDLIAALAADTTPPPRLGANLALACAATAVLAMAVMVVWLGLRPDLMTGAALHTRPFWMKAGYTLWLSLAGWVAVSRLARPGARLGPAAWLAGLGLAVMVSMGSLRMWLTAPSLRLAQWLGHSWTVCPRNILIIAIPVFVGVIWVMRRFAPTRLRLAGAGAGLLSGAIAAAVYSLHCPETGAAFVATWYSLGIAACAAIGALLGPRLLRW